MLEEYLKVLIQRMEQSEIEREFILQITNLFVQKYRTPNG